MGFLSVIFAAILTFAAQVVTINDTSATYTASHSLPSTLRLASVSDRQFRIADAECAITDADVAKVMSGFSSIERRDYKAAKRTLDKFVDEMNACRLINIEQPRNTARDSLVEFWYAYGVAASAAADLGFFGVSATTTPDLAHARAAFNTVIRENSDLADKARAGLAYVDRLDAGKLPTVPQIYLDYKTAHQAAQSARERAMDSKRHGRYAEAISYYDQALAAVPNNAENYAERAESYYQIGDWERALQDCNESIQRNPSLYLGFYLRGLLRWRDHLGAAAGADFTTAVENINWQGDAATDAIVAGYLAFQDSADREKASELLRHCLGGCGGSDLGEEAVSYLRGGATDAAIYDPAQKPTEAELLRIAPKLDIGYAHAVIGLNHLGKGDAKGGQDHIRQALNLLKATHHWVPILRAHLK